MILIPLMLLMLLLLTVFSAAFLTLGSQGWLHASNLGTGRLDGVLGSFRGPMLAMLGDLGPRGFRAFDFGPVDLLSI